jgi:hypothetical protein
MTLVAANAFERHGLQHLSASSLNLWAAEPALWIMERLFGRKAPSGVPAARGRAVEAGVHLGLVNPALPAEDCIAEAERAFDRETVFNGDPRRAEERKKLAGYVRGALAELRQYGPPDDDGYQSRIEIRLEDVPVPIIGFLDWRFSTHGLIVDLKTTERFPSAIGARHGRQGAVYATALGNYGMRFAYAKPSAGKTDTRQVLVLELSAQEVREHLGALRLIALSLGRFLSVSTDPQELAGLIVPDFTSFWWADPAARAAGRETYGF